MAAGVVPEGQQPAFSCSAGRARDRLIDVGFEADGHRRADLGFPTKLRLRRWWHSSCRRYSSADSSPCISAMNWALMIPKLRMPR